MRPKKILFYGEGSLLTTGYGVYARNLLTHLHKTGKYEVAEIGGFVRTDDPRIKEFPWRVFPNCPADPALQEQFHARPTNQWGEFVCDGVCLQYKPDIVLSIRDWWNDEYLLLSPARPYFNFIHMAQVDSAPQRPQWLHSFAQIDKVLTYTDWGLDVLRKEGQGNINLIKAAGSGVDIEHFKQQNKSACRDALCIEDDRFIILTVMRNQTRKLFPDLFKTFRQFLEQAPSPIAAKSYLYVHSRQPDISWNFNELIQEHGIGHRTLFSYVCHACRAVFSSLYRGTRCTCTACGQEKAEMPGVLNGVSPNVLSLIYNSADAYVQYSVSEGFGMSMPEAAACGVPVFAVDYSAMTDVVRKLNGFPIRVERMFREQNVGADRAYPNNQDLLNKLVWYSRLPTEMRLKYQNLAKKGVADHYTWEKVSSVWEEVIDATGYGYWDRPMNIHAIPNTPPPNCSNEDFIRWGFEQVASRPNLIRTRFFDEMLSDLNNGFCESNKQPFDREKAFAILAGWGEMKNNFEKQRCGD